MRSVAVLAGLAVLPAVAQDASPFFQEWKTPFGVPPFAQIKEEHFLPAFKEGMARQKAEVQAICEAKDAPTFKNTIEALDVSGELLDQIGSVFNNLTGAETNEKRPLSVLWLV